MSSTRTPTEVLQRISKAFRAYVKHPHDSPDSQPDWLELCLAVDEADGGGHSYPGGVLADPGIPMILQCPQCNARHIDTGVFERKEHHTHACQACGFCWRPAIVATRGVRFLPGFKNTADDDE